jgi:hypothetical protein
MKDVKRERGIERQTDRNTQRWNDGKTKMKKTER